MKTILFLIFDLISAFGVCSVENTENYCHKTTEGTDFWFAFMEGRMHEDGHFVEITLTSPVMCNYEIRIGKSEEVYLSGIIYEDSPERITINWELIEAIGSETIQEKAIHLTSDNPMNVFALNYCPSSSDVALIFPTNTLGKEYFAICYEPNHEVKNGVYLHKSNSEFLIVATEDNTSVSISPSKITDKNRSANVPFNITLSKGEVYQVQSMNLIDQDGQGDLTGSYIKSTKPVAFFSGSMATTVPSGPQVDAWDHLFEQIPPVHTWGSKFLAVPLKSREKDIYRIVAAYDNTAIKVGKSNLVISKKGEFLEFTLNYDDPQLIESSKPILLVQYSCSRSVDTNFTNGNGDPFMVVISPLIQTKQNVTFVAYNSFEITDRYFVNVIAKNDALPYISLDGISIIFTSVPKSGYSYAQVPIHQGNHLLQSSQDGKGFIAYVYGFGGYDSYGYGAGYNLDIQLDLGFKYLMNDSLPICNGTELKLEAGAYFDNYLWSTGENKPVILATKAGKYKITASTIEGCVLSDSVFIKVIKPNLYLGNDTTICAEDSKVLDAGNNFKSYLWQNRSTNQTLTVFETGDYSVTVTNELGCKATDTIHVEVLNPYVSFTPKNNEVTINHPEITFINETVGATEYFWDFGDGSVSAEFNPTHRYERLGKYQVNLKATSETGCTSNFSTEIEVVKLNFKIPNAFRPDSDIPENRIFKPVMKAIRTDNYNFKIFNRVGSIVFETNNPENGWDGIEFEPGLFVWMVKYTDIQGYSYTTNGTVMLVK